MIDSKQNFLKGINRRFTREQSIDPDFFYTLQNARIFSRGETGTVKRINGYQKFNQNSKDYSGTLDMISYLQFFIVFYKDGGDFSVDVIDTNGNVTFTDSYSGEDTDEGSMTISDDNIFITPHNKVLYYNQGNWVLADYISEIGGITGIELAGDAGVAQGNITVHGDIGGGFEGNEAKGWIRINKNNTPRGENDVFQVSVGGTVTGDITVTYQDNLHDIKDKIYDAVTAVTAITDVWDITVNSRENRASRGSRNGSSPGIVTFTAKNKTSSLNGTEIAILNTSFNIGDFDYEDNNRGRGDGKRFVDDNNDDDGRIENRFGNEEFNITYKIKKPSGGRDSVNNIGPLRIKVYRLGNTYSILTDDITSNDSYAQIGDKIYQALNNDNTFNTLYDVSTTDTGTEFIVQMTAVRGGKDLNSKVQITFMDYHSGIPRGSLPIAKSNISGGSNADPNGLLETFEDFWYKVRYRFKDGHVTNMTFPKHINTEVYSEVRVTIDSSLKDIDGNRTQVELFRKQKSGNFHLIQRINPDSDVTVFVDDGKPEKVSAEEKNNIWTKSHNAQTVIDNRLVRGGVSYFDEKYSGKDNINFSIVNTSSEDQLPSKSGIKLYIKPQYKDGTFGYHQLVDELRVTDFDKKLQVEQTGLLTNNDKEIVEVGMYGKFIPRSGEDNLEFNTVEIANKNISTISDTSYYPNRTRILFGFKYVEISHAVDTDMSLGVENAKTDKVGFRVDGWNESDNPDLLWTQDGVVPAGGSGKVDPRTDEITVEVFGMPTKYVRQFTYKNSFGTYSTVYKLASFDALKEAAKTRQLRVRFRLQTQGDIMPVTGDEILTQLTTGLGNDILSVDVKVTSLIDNSLQYEEVDIVESDTDGFDLEQGFAHGPFDSRIYLELEESIFDEIENSNVNDYSIAKIDGERPSMQTSNSVPLELVDFSQNEDVQKIASNHSDALDGGAPRSLGDKTYYAYEWDWGLYDLINHDDLRNEDRMIYLGSKPNEISALEDLDVMGYRNMSNNILNFTFPNPFNIYDLEISREDINVERTEFLNQIIWSGKILESTRYSQERNISPENFFPLPTKHGRILKMYPLGGRLYVFCERGVLVCMIGETMARQKNDEVVVTDSNFITGYFWIKEDLNDIKHDSILKKDNTIYFTDGYDVYQVREKTKNITEGSIPLDPTHDYSSTCDDQNDELKISDLTDGLTWVYNYKFEQWYGPFTYVDTNGANLNEKVVSVIGNKIVEHNIGNTFDGQSFATIIESVANDTEQSFTDKNYRKFYIQVENNGNTFFRYGKIPDQMAQVSMSDMREVMGEKHQGISPQYQNSKVIYWDIETTDEGFILDDISWKFRNKRRT